MRLHRAQDKDYQKSVTTESVVVFGKSVCENSCHYHCCAPDTLLEKQTARKQENNGKLKSKKGTAKLMQN